MKAITCQILHVWWFHVNYSETLFTDVQIPQVNPKVVRGNEGLTITMRRKYIQVLLIDQLYCMQQSVWLQAIKKFFIREILEPVPTFSERSDTANKYSPTFNSREY